MTALSQQSLEEEKEEMREEVKIETVDRVVPIISLRYRCDTPGEANAAATIMRDMLDLITGYGIDVYVRSPVTVHRTCQPDTLDEAFDIMARIGLDGKGEAYGGKLVATTNYQVVIRGLKNDHEE